MNRLLVDQIAIAVPGAPRIGPLSLHVGPGEVLALVGPSGAGKTTLLRAIAGLLPSVGTVTAGGERVDHLPPERRGVVYLHQTPRLFEHLDVLGNVAFPLALRANDRAASITRARELLAMVQLEALAGRGVAHLSGGERQRVALARAIAAAPRAILLDEPFAALDPGLRAGVRDALTTLLRGTAPATVLVTHDLDEAGLLASQLAVLLDGSLAQVGTPSTVFSAPASLAVAAFLEIPNRWPAPAAAQLVPGAPARAITAVLPADAVRAVRDPDGPATVIRVTPTRERRLLMARQHDLDIHAVVEGELPTPGERVAVVVDSHRASWFDVGGARIDEG
jgi:ABC-type sulfate/molybdate transport systems ATPase subunit